MTGCFPICLSSPLVFVRSSSFVQSIRIRLCRTLFMPCLFLCVYASSRFHSIAPSFRSFLICGLLVAFLSSALHSFFPVFLHSFGPVLPCFRLSSLPSCILSLLASLFHSFRPCFLSSCLPSFLFRSYPCAMGMKHKYISTQEAPPSSSETAQGTSKQHQKGCN